MFCKNCGEEISDTVKFCSKCGTPTSGEVSVSSNSVYSSSEPSLLKDLFYWEGRRGKQKYTMVLIISTLLSFVCMSTVVLSLLICYVSYVNFIKRLHDCNKPASLAHLAFTVQIIGMCLAFYGLFVGGISLTLGSIMTLGITGLEIWYCTVDGDTEANQYGPLPGDRF